MTSISNSKDETTPSIPASPKTFSQSASMKTCVEIRYVTNAKTNINYSKFPFESTFFLLSLYDKIRD